VGAGLLALLKAEKRRIPQEAFIGIVYAVSAAAAILIVDRTPEGAEHIKFMFVGNLLATSPKEVATLAVLYLVIGTLHFVWRKPFFAITHGRPAEAGLSRAGVRWWDFLFYLIRSGRDPVGRGGRSAPRLRTDVPSVIAMLLADRQEPPSRLDMATSRASAGSAAIFIRPAARAT
jgi:hypothetical protein